ncbi:MAG: DUF3164 family protein [Bacteroidales bacterium]
MEKKEIVEMTAEEKARYEAFIAAEKAKEAKAMAEKQREEYKDLVNSMIEESIPSLLKTSELIKKSKEAVQANFRSVIEMKAELFGLKNDKQRSHTFTNLDGDKRITLGVYTADAYRDTAEDGIEIVKEYLQSLATDRKSKELVGAVMKLLARDAKGTLKASRVIQLRKMADESGNERFIEGVNIITEAYQPTVTKQYVRAEIKNEHGAWVNIPLGMTES